MHRFPSTQISVRCKKTSDAILLHAQKAPPQNMQCSCATAYEKKKWRKVNKKREPKFPCFCPFFTLFQPCLGWFLPIIEQLFCLPVQKRFKEPQTQTNSACAQCKLDFLLVG